MPRKTKEIPAKAPKRKPRRPAGVPDQQDIDVWPILSDPAVAAAEVAKGKHDECVRLLAHVSRSQGLEVVLEAAEARIAKLEG